MATVRRYDDMSKSEIMEEIHGLQQQLGGELSLREVLHELQVREEEIRVQQNQLLDAQRALEESRDRYADLFDFAPIGYVTLDRSGVIHECNFAAANLLGVERARLLGFPLLVNVAEGDRRTFLGHLSRCRDSSGTVETRLRIKRRGGQTFPACLVSRRASSPDGTIWHTAILDLTESERAEAERRRAEDERHALAREEQALRAAGEAKDRFLAVLSHELRTPLTPILFTLASLEAREALPAEARESLDLMRRNIELEARLIDDLLDTTRIAHGKLHLEFEVVDVHAALDDVVGMCAEDLARGGLVLEFEKKAREHHVLGDATRLRQVFWNLVKNSIRYTPRGGRVRVRSVTEEPGAIKVVVQDTGSGIEPSLLERLFTPFQQGIFNGTQRAGLGLGLAISKGIVEAHDGRIACSSPGRDAGARFEVELRTVAPPAEKPSAPQTPRAPASKPRILLVEDHPDTAMTLGELLSVHGYEVAIAESRADALRRRDEPFDLLITDIGLPDGDGLELLGELRGERSLLAIAVSGYGAEGDIDRSRRAGFDLHLTKPVHVADLLQAIEKLWSRRETMARRAGA